MAERVEDVRQFLCYAPEDKERVEELCRSLSSEGFNPWLAFKDILPGTEKKPARMKAIRECAFFLACLSNNSINKRGDVQEEIKEALAVWREKRDDDIYLIPVRLEECEIPEALNKFQCADLFEKNGVWRLTKAINAGIDLLDIKQPRKFRSQASTGLSEGGVKKMLQENDFFDQNWYWMGKGVQHQYEKMEDRGGKLVVDHITGLTWQQSGSQTTIQFSDAKNYVLKLNEIKYGGYSAWRLPTLEEGMSLMEAKPSNNLYVDSVFDERQKWLLTADKNRDSKVWLVDFIVGRCSLKSTEIDGYVRAIL